MASPEMKNRVIVVSGVGARSGFSALMVDHLPCLDMIEKSQCFPLNIYEKTQNTRQGSLLAASDEKYGYQEKDGITDAGLAHFQAAYPKENVTREDLFCYIYGLLHSEEYRTRFADNLSKQLPCIPSVKKTVVFWAFVEAGRKLGALHVDYEKVEPFAVTIDGNPKADEDYYVAKMKFGKLGKEKDKTTVIYNDHITIKDIPLEAYDYIINGKSALDWVMDRWYALGFPETSQSA